MKKQLVAVRLTDKQTQQLDNLVEAGFGNRSDVLRIGLDRIYQKEIVMKKEFDRQSYLVNKFLDLGIGDLEEIWDIDIDNLEKMIDEIKALLEKFDGGVESNDFMDALGIVVNRYI